MTDKKIIWSPHAADDLKAQFEWIKADSPARAREWVGKLFEQIERLKRFPQLGRLIPEIGQSRYRELVVGEYRIFHEIRPKDILIFRIFHAKRLFPS